MSRTTGGSGPRHERAHDPARADWHDWSAQHPEPERFGRVVDPTDLAPYASTGGHSAYSPQGQWIQTGNFGRAMLTDDRRSVESSAGSWHWPCSPASASRPASASGTSSS